MARVNMCKDCDHWERDGSDGICRAKAPRPEIIVGGQTYNLIWPRMRADERCGEWKPIGMEEHLQ